MKLPFLLLFLMVSPSALAMGKSNISSASRESPVPLHTEADCGDADPLTRKSQEIQAFFSFPRNQLDFGDCFANTAADLATFASGVPVSALDLNFLYEGSGQTLLDRILHGRWHETEVRESGITLGALYAGDKKGFCPEAIIPSSRTESTIKAVADDLTDPKGSALLVDALFPSLSADQISEKTRRLAQVNINDAFRALTLQACSGKRIKVGHNFTAEDRLWPDLSVDPDGPIQMLDAALSNNTIAAVSLHAKSLVAASVVPNLDKFNDNHGVIIEARHWSGGQCWYTIRNSWGKDCSVYNLDPASLTCDPDTGLAQISEGLLRNVMYGVTYLKRK